MSATLLMSFFPICGYVCAFAQTISPPRWACMHLSLGQFFPLGGDVCIFVHVSSIPWVGMSAPLLMPVLSPGWGGLHLSLCYFVPLDGDVCTFAHASSFPWVGRSASFLVLFFSLGWDVCMFVHVGFFPWVGRSAFLFMPVLSPGCPSPVKAMFWNSWKVFSTCVITSTIVLMLIVHLLTNCIEMLQPLGQVNFCLFLKKGFHTYPPQCKISSYVLFHDWHC